MKFSSTEIFSLSPFVLKSLAAVWENEWGKRKGSQLVENLISDL